MANGEHLTQPVTGGNRALGSRGAGKRLTLHISLALRAVVSHSVGGIVHAARSEAEEARRPADCSEVRLTLAALIPPPGRSDQLQEERMAHSQRLQVPSDSNANLQIRFPKQIDVYF